VSEFIPLDFGLVVARAFHEWQRRRAIFELPAAQFHRPRAGLDLSADIRGQRVANPLGPAAGPHTQLAPNLVTAWLAGGRVFELKTVQVPDRARVHRPSVAAGVYCAHVDMAHELALEQTLHEYVGASMLIDMLRKSRILDTAQSDDISAAAEPRFDLSLGGDLRSLQSQRLVGFVRACQDARPVIDELRARIPKDFAALRGTEFRREVVQAATLVPPEGASLADIEALADFVLRELRLDLTLKLRPTVLGYEACTELLHATLGDKAPRPIRAAFEREPEIGQIAPLLQQLQHQARARGVSFGVKLVGSLHVHDPERRFATDSFWLSGPPLQTLALEAFAALRAIVGPELAVSLGGGIGAENVARTVACHAFPVTSCTDLLGPGGAARLGRQLAALEAELERTGVRTLGDFVLRAEGQGEAAAHDAVAELVAAMRQAFETADPARRAMLAAETERFAATLARRAAEAVRGSPFQHVRAALGAVWHTRAETLRSILKPERERADVEALYQRMVQLAGARNVPAIAARARIPAAAAPAAGFQPTPKLGTRLSLWDCVSCDLCVPACPNGANFAYEVLPSDLEYDNYELRGGTLVAAGHGRFTVARSHQLAHVADLCNDCGHCEAACPEDGGPFAAKPRFFTSLESWQQDGGPGFHVRHGANTSIWGRFAPAGECLLQVSAARDTALFKSNGVEIDIDPRTHTPLGVRGTQAASNEGVQVDMQAYHVLRMLLDGVTDPRRVHWVNGARP
jgi:putative selenate reductase